MGSVRPEIEIFGEKMEAEMRKNDKKKGESWKTMSVSDLINMRDAVIGKVDMCLDDPETGLPLPIVDKDKAVEKLVGEANYCMMLAYRILED